MKKKARIFLEDSCVLIGVVDDRGILGPNEVYIQIRKGGADAASNDNRHRKARSSSSKFFDAFKEVIREGENLQGAAAGSA